MPCKRLTQILQTVPNAPVVLKLHPCWISASLKKFRFIIYQHNINSQIPPIWPSASLKKIQAHYLQYDPVPTTLPVTEKELSLYYFYLIIKELKKVFYSYVCRIKKNYFVKLIGISI